MTIEDDIEWDNDNDDAQAIMVMMALTASCIVMKEYIHKKKLRQKKKKGGRPFTISRQRMSILLIQQLMSDLYFKWSYHFSHTEIENLIQCIGPHFVISTNEKKTAPNGLIPMETKLLVSIRVFAGGSAYNIFPLFGIGHTSFFRCVWVIVNAINKTTDMRIEFPHQTHKTKTNCAWFHEKKHSSV